MSYINSEKILGISYVDSWTRRYYKASNNVVVPFAIQYPRDYDSNPSANPSEAESYPLIVCSGGSYSLGNDCLGFIQNRGYYMYNSACLSYFLSSSIPNGSSKYWGNQKYFCIVVQLNSPDHTRGAWEVAVVELCKKLRDDSNVLCYTLYGTNPLGDEISGMGRPGQGSDVRGNSGYLPYDVRLDSNRIYYSGYSEGSLDSWGLALLGRDLWAAVFPLVCWVGINSRGVVPDEFVSFANKFSLYIDSGGTQNLNSRIPTTMEGWDEENEEYISSKWYTIVNNQELNYIVFGHLLRRIKHIPILAYTDGELLYSGVSNQGVFNLWNYLKSEESGWANFIWANRYQESVGGQTYFDPHWSSNMFRRVCGLGGQYRFNFDENNPSPMSLVKDGSGVTCFDWLMSKSRDTNPTMEDDPGWPTVISNVSSIQGNIRINKYESVEVQGNKNITIWNNEGVITIKEGNQVLYTLTEGQNIFFEHGCQMKKINYIQDETDYAVINAEVPKKYMLSI